MSTYRTSRNRFASRCHRLQKEKPLSKTEDRGFHREHVHSNGPHRYRLRYLYKQLFNYVHSTEQNFRCHETFFFFAWVLYVFSAFSRIDDGNIKNELIQTHTHHALAFGRCVVQNYNYYCCSGSAARRQRSFRVATASERKTRFSKKYRANRPRLPSLFFSIRP